MTALVLASWLLRYAVHSTLLLGVAWAASRRVRSLPLRELLWKAALVGGVLTASVQPLLGPRPGWTEVEVERHVLLPGSGGAARPAAPALRREGAPDWALAVGAAWLAGTGAGLGLLGRRRRDAWRSVGPRAGVGDPAYRAMLSRLRGRFGVPREVRLTASERIPTPAAIGAGEVCIPERVFGLLSPEQQESVLAHEVAHLARRDPWWRLAADVVVAAFFFQPLNRVARRELRELAEFLCDDAVVVRTGARRPLAESLARLASVVAAAPDDPLLSGLAHPGSPLVRRVGRILGEEGPPSVPLHPARSAVLAGLLLAPVAGLAPALPVPSPRQVAVEVSPGGKARPGAPVTGKAAPGSFLRVRERRGATERLLEVVPTPSGGLRYEYRVNGRPAELDAGARRLLAEVPGR